MLAAGLLAVASLWAAPAEADQGARDPVSDWNLIMADMEPPSGFFMHTRLGALLHVAIHDALNAIPKTARYHTYLSPVAAHGPTSPEAALAGAARTMLTNYIAFFSDPAVPPPFYNPTLVDIAPRVDALYEAQLSAIADGPAKTKGIRIGENTANTLWNARLNDGWDNPDGAVFAFPDNDGDGNPMTGLAGEYVMLEPADTFPDAPQPAFFWWGEVAPWTMTENDQFLCPPPPDPADSTSTFLEDMEEVRLYADVDSTVRTPEQTFAALWWEACPGSTLPSVYTFTRQLVSDFRLDTYESARVFALMTLTEADAMISNVNSKNRYQFWRPITAINFYYPDSNWRPFMLTPPNQEYPAGHPMVSGAGMYALVRFFGDDTLEHPLIGTSSCGDLVFASLKDAIEGVINARVWGGMHYRGSGEVGARTGKRIARYIHRNFLRPL